MEQVIFRNKYVCTCMRAITINEKRAMNLKASGQGYMGGFEEVKRSKQTKTKQKAGNYKPKVILTVPRNTLLSPASGVRHGTCPG